KNPRFNCLGKSNFSASINPIGGTPGKENSILDSTFSGLPLVFKSPQILTENSIWLEFENPISSLDTTGFEIQLGENLLLDSYEFSNEGISIRFQTEIPLNVDLDISIIGLQDCAGNRLENSSFSFVRYRIPQPGDLVITEIMADPTPSVGLPEVEYLEIYNQSPFSVNLNESVILGKKVNQNWVLEAGAYSTISSKEGAKLFEAIGQEILGVEGLSSSFLNNSGSVIDIVNPAGDTVVSQIYSADWHTESYAKQGGYSLALRDISVSCTQNPFAWASSLDDTGGSPGKPNSTRPIDIKNILDLARLSINGPVIKAVFNDAVLWNPEHFEYQGFSTSPELSYSAEDALGFLLRDSIELGKKYEILVKGQRCFSQEIVEATIEFTKPEAPANRLFINEILYDPAGNSGEYIELYNASESSISLNGLYLQSSPLGTKYLIDSTGYVLPENSYVLISKDTTDLGAQYPEFKPQAYLAEATMPTLSNAGSPIILSNREGEIIDQLNYQPDWHFGDLINTQGVALEKINPSLASENSSNWTSAASSVNYGTPGSKNSQFTLSTSSGKLVIEPEFFSPDNDGFEDNCIISINGLVPGSTLKVEIFNQKGLLVAKPTEKVLAGTDNEISWNGEDINGFRLARGIYLVVVTLQNQGGKTVLKKPVTIG
ncbi:MAG: lamin tail domain-containing protein, partial [Luteibaculum sp.]